MSRKANILVEVDDRVYDLVIAPHKKNKSFAKLVTALITGYAENAYVRDYADGVLDGSRRASLDTLDSIISDIHSGLANMGMYTDELKNISDEGIDTFKDGGSKARNAMEQHINERVEQETKELREDLKAIKNQNEEFMNMMKMFMGNMMGGGMAQGGMFYGGINPNMGMNFSGMVPPNMNNVYTQATQVQQETPVKEVVKEPVVSQQPVYEEVKEQVEQNDIWSDIDSDDEKEIDASDLLSSLTDGNKYEY